VAQTTGTDFSTLVGEWQLANVLTARSGFSEATGRLRYTSWNLGSVFPATFGEPYPLQPDTATAQPYSHIGVLVPGSGRHLEVIQEPMSPEVDVQLSAPGGDPVSAAMLPRIAVARMR
jgi:hypothetical protein